MVLSSLIPALTGAVGSVASGFLNFFGQNSANKANRAIVNDTNQTNMQIAQNQMDFQERMSNSAWQRGLEDMKKAGINPMLAASQGGASSPVGASIGAVTGAPMQNKYARAMESAREIREAIMTNTVINKTRAETDLNKALAEAAKADALLKSNSAKNVNLQSAGLELEDEINRTTYGKILRYAKPAAELLKGIKK